MHKKKITVTLQIQLTTGRYHKLNWFMKLRKENVGMIQVMGTASPSAEPLYIQLFNWYVSPSAEPSFYSVCLTGLYCSVHSFLCNVQWYFFVCSSSFVFAMTFPFVFSIFFLYVQQYIFNRWLIMYCWKRRDFTDKEGHKYLMDGPTEFQYHYRLFKTD